MGFLQKKSQISGNKTYKNFMSECWRVFDEFLAESDLDSDDGETENYGIDKELYATNGDVETFIQIVGNTISMSCLLVAISIFLSFK